jgi:hypothetical protein
MNTISNETLLDILQDRAQYFYENRDWEQFSEVAAEIAAIMEEEDEQF